MILARQKYVFDKKGLGYNFSNNEKYFKNYFVKESTSESPLTIFNLVVEEDSLVVLVIF